MADEKENFVHLHTHSSASLLDGAMGIESLVEEVARRGNPAVALTDHGTVRGHYRLTEMAEKHGVKPIYGAELYCVEDLESVGNGAPTEDEIAEVDDEKKTRDEAIAEARKKLDKIRYHITVWALNQAGLANLNRLSSKAWTHGFYYKPRVDLAMLREFSDGLAVGTGCRASLVNRPLSEKKPRVADSMLGKLVDIFGDRLRVEIMAHDTDGQRDANRFALIAISCGLRPVVTQDAHYLSEADSSHHEVLLAIGTHKSVGDEKGFKFDATSYWLKTRDELADSFRRYHGYIPGDVVERALDGTVELAGLCDAKIEINPLKGLLPSGLYPNGFKSDTEYFLHLIKRGMQWRDLPRLAEVTARYRGDEDVESIYQGYLRQIKHEFSVLKKSGFIPYFLMIYEICEWARDNGIMMGPGRGSAAGSIISFLLGITHVDPIYHGLMFERFIGVGRVNLPDCFPSGTRVLCRRGWIGIELIGVGDEVLTRFGWRKVVAKHSRMTRIGEGLITITWRDFEGNVRSLTCTPNHPIFHNTNGKIKSTRAESQKIGSRIIHLSKMRRSNPEGKLPSADVMCEMSNRFSLCCMREGIYSQFTPWEKTKSLFSRLCIKNESDQSSGNQLQGLRSIVSTTRGKSRDLFNKMSVEKPPFISSFKILRGVRKGIQKLYSETKDVFAEMREFIGVNVGIEPFSREDWIQEGFRAFCSFLTRGGLCKITQNQRNRIPIRIGTYPYEERENLHSRFCRRGQDNRVEGLGGTRPTEDRDCESGIGGSFHGILLRRCSEGDKGNDPSRFGQSGKFRNIKREIFGFQDGRKTMSDMLGNVSIPDYSGSRNMQSILCESQTENRSGGDGDSQGNCREVRGMFERDQDVQGSKKGGKFLFDRMYNYCEEGEIVDIRKKEGVWEIYDLTVEEHHEYFAEDVLVHNCDLDFDDLRRDEIYQHLKDRYGADHVSMIATSGRLNGKQAIRDVCRVLEIPYQEAEIAAGAIESDPEDKHEIRTALKRSEIFRKFAKDHPTAVKHADALEGLTKSLGVHAAGVIVSPVPVVEVAPVEIRDGDRDKIVTAFDMRGIEGVGLVKIDLLGLRTVRTLRLARDMIRARGVDIDLNTIPIDDPETLRGFTEHDFSGVFQFDSSSAHYVCDGIDFREFKDLAAINALNRPGGISFVDEFKKRHEHPDKIGDVFHPKVSAITANAYGLMIYQEHVIRVATDVAGFSPGDADALRKKIGKKEGAASIEKLREQFVSGCLATTPDLGHDGSNRLFDYIVKFSRYGFNLAHSVCYSLIAYHCMYLKRHYPTEFYCAILITEKDSKELQRFVVDAKNRYGISVVLPDVNKSGVGLSVTGDREISAALSDIKGVNERAAEHIVETRAAGGPFKSFVDFLSRTQRKLVRKNSVLALIQSGALDSVVKNPRWYSTEFERLWVAVDKKKYLQVEAAERAANSSNWVWDTDTRLLIASQVCPIIAKPHPIVNFQSWLNENIDGVIEPITRELVTTKKNIFVAGAVDSVVARSVGDGMKYDQIPDEGEQEKMGFGRLWYYIVLRGITGETLKVKIDKSLVDTFPWVAITPSWEPVIVFGTVCPEWNYVDAHYIANLNNLVESVKNKGELSVWDRMFLRRSNPFALKKWKSATDGKIAVNGPKTLSSDRLRAVGIVSRAVEKTDRKGDKMGMLYLLVRRGAIRVLVFSNQWSTMKNYLSNGQLILSELEKLKGDAYSLVSIKVFSVEK